MNYSIKIILPSLGGKLSFGVCTKGDFDRLSDCGFSGCSAVVKKYCESKERWDSLPKFERERLCNAYGERICGIIEEWGVKLKVPKSRLMHDPDMPDNIFPSNTIAEKLVYDYTGIDFMRQEGMNCLLWRQYLCDAVKYNLSGTPDGVTILNSAYDEMFVPFDRNDFLSGK